MPDDITTAPSIERPAHHDAFGLVRPTQPEPTPIMSLARQLAAAWQRQDDLDEQHRHTEDPSTKLKIEAQETTVICRVLALNDLIATMPAQNAAEATIQVALAIGALARVPRDPDGDVERADRLLSSALALLLRETGIDIHEYAIAPYVVSGFADTLDFPL